MAYVVEKRYGIKNLFDWDMLCQSPGWIADRVLRSIGLRCRPPGKQGKGKKRAPVVRLGGVPVPPELSSTLGVIGPKYYPSRQRKIGEILEADALREAGINPDFPEHLTFRQPSREEEVLSIPGPGLRRSNAVRVDPVGERYRPPHIRVNYPKDGDLCPVCGSVMRPCLAQSRTDKFDWIDRPDAEYWNCYGLSQTGLYTANEIAEMFPSQMTEHRRRLADRRWKECHPVRCTLDVQHSKVNYETC